MDLNEMNKQNGERSWKNKEFFSSLKHALDGVATIFREEKNMRHHTALGILPLLLAWYFQVNAMEWIILILCVFLVVILEFLNTIFETVVDMITDYQYHPLAKRAKDIAAGAVLVSAFFTVIVAAIIFLPKIYGLLIQ